MVPCAQCGVEITKHTKKRPERPTLCVQCGIKKRVAASVLVRRGFSPLCTKCGNEALRNGLCREHIAEQALSFELQNISREEILDRSIPYLAGIIDGEGTICIFRCNPNRFRAILSISNTSVALMDWLDSSFGEHSREVNRTRDHELRFKKCYHWTVTNAEAARIAKLVLPYLVVKRKQAELFIEFVSTSFHFGKRGVPKELWARRDDIATEMAFLNRRGSDAMDVSLSA